MTQLRFPHGASVAGAPERAGARAVPPGRANLAVGPTIALGPAMLRWTGRRDGDMGDPSGVDAVVRSRRQAVVGRPWSWLTQVHGAAVAVVDRPGGSAGQAADAAVSAVPGVVLAILSADCAPVAFASPEGVTGVAHAGWRGLMAGVVEETIGAMRRLGARSIVAALGPCIHAECYAFGPEDLDAAAGRFGPSVKAETRAGHPALDIPRAVELAVRHAGAELVLGAGVCTSCSPEHWSWRARQDRQRQATVLWLP